MKPILILMSLLVSTFAAPAPGSDSSEVAAHANEALRLMEMYRLYQQQGLGNPFLPPHDVPAGHLQAQVAPVPAEENSDEEDEDGSPAARVAVPGAPAAASLNSDEEEEVEEAEVAEVEPSVVDAAPADPTAAPAADPAAAAEPEVVAIPAEVVPVDGVVVVVPPVDVVPVDTEVALDVAGPVATDTPAVDVAAATAAAEVLAVL